MTDATFPADARAPGAVARSDVSGASASRIQRLQILRAIAACSVVYFHVISNYLPAGSPLHYNDNYRLLAGGVDVFFFISGFLIRTTTWNSYGRANVADYLKKRCARVVPYYWLVTGFLVLLSLIAPDAFRSYQFEWRHALASFLFLPWPRPDGAIYPPLVQGWSLNFEVLFYMVFAALMVLASRERAALWLASIFGAAVLGCGLAGGEPQLFIAGSPYVLEFVAGALFADLWRSRAGKFPPAFGWLALGLGLCLLVLNTLTLAPLRWVVQISGYTACSIAFMTLPGCKLPLRLTAGLALLGEASYSIYLIHPVVLSPLAQVLAKFGLAGGHTIVILTWIPALAIGLSLLAWRWVEQPLLAMSRRAFGLR